VDAAPSTQTAPHGPSEARGPGGLRLVIGMMTAPAQILREHARRWPPGVSLVVSGSAFALFFLQTGLDQLRTGKASAAQVAELTLLGAVYGVVGIALVATVAWVLTRPFEQGKPLAWAIQAYTLAYAPALVYGLVGMLFSLLAGWRTAVAFGVTGALWALYPMMAVNDELTGQRRPASATLTAVLGCIVLVGWTLLGTR
jgi:hypothetical protein